MILGPPAWKRLISRTFSPYEVVSLIETTLTDENEVEMIDNLHGDDAQILVDVIYEVHLHLLHSRAAV